ncbi:hypothetical protein PR003_g19580 [Phytophthora rubi]|uniref:Uncharacterized protein n=1 Tax=Phytophthora rubi TaxID=129364 RepID=A0A6A3JHV3_9STRA|nr:hypothetical protein PR002_g21888 [Phytophthora rubi]KAE8993098.1 hypothetical protein PR001_g20760 [Phytophthora rubi]KAE9313129.1 hypothetical protein PR003_g19580 [Phytophthora rubi]
MCWVLVTSRWNFCTCLLVGKDPHTTAGFSKTLLLTTSAFLKVSDFVLQQDVTVVSHYYLVDA